MGVFLATAVFAFLGVTITAVVLLARHKRLTPEARYQRESGASEMAKYVDTTPRYTPQQGDPGITPGGGTSGG